MRAPEPPPLPAGLRRGAFASALLCELPLLLHVPTTLALLLGAVALLVAVFARARPWPAWLRLPLLLLLVLYTLAAMRFGIGRDTAGALLAAMLALKPAETSSLRDARSLLGFALFAPFAAFLLDQGPWTLLLGMLGTVAVLINLLALADHASQVAPTPWRPALWRVLALAGLGLPLALAAFWLFPRLATPLWGLPDRAVARPGLSDSMAPGAWLDLLTDDTPALRAQFFGATPPRTALYWRGPVLSDFDGQTWRRSRLLAGLPAPVLVAGTPQWRYRLELEPTDRRSVPALDLPLGTPAGLLRDHGEELRSTERLVSLRQFRFSSAPAVRFEADLPAMVRTTNLASPAANNPRTRALAQSWRAAAGEGVAADRAIVNRALAMFRREFAYTLTTPLPGRDGVDEFLFDTRAGFCEHFSGAFTLLMRDAGIPARVVTGYAGGSYNPLGDYWLVRYSDAHAWSEVWLQGQGWVRVDPTAAVAPERIYDTLADRAEIGGGLAGFGGMFAAGDWLRRGWNDLVLGFDAARQRALLQPLGLEHDNGPQRQLLVLGLLSALLIGAVLAWLSRRERERDPLLAAWHRLSQRYARHGLARAAHEPALGWAARVCAARPATSASHELATLSARFAAQRYAAQADADPRALLHALRRHRP